MAPQPQGGGPRITATGDIIWPGPNPSTRQQGLALPLAAGGQQQQQQQGIACVSAFTVLLCLIGLCLHEFAHAATAYQAGVEGVAESGYLTCDLIRYVGILDVLIFVFFVATGGIVLPGGRVNIDERAVRSRGWKTAIALAGPATNLLLGMLGSFCVQVYILAASANPSIIPLPIIGLICFIFLQFMSAVVNLIPFPPLE
ncbi:sterol-regulatory element binding protein site 2 protease, putative [Eimeria tenella]|uniref:Sterol-regulatory element binding protein site 2 protease, putative n=1 Tax=Eimeria tenella TaxID=5802 RepID=U6KY56_EIMTE|nr:sterol-regulatory element binding protein site 2 protease, putative [Eimeria tenella]CDJ43087.1 sterol-regulatory element binding protein site 2 protease, putative [Eimeria tenella]|eukprot:XP_013233837.1 sterol-regulatory element binding protein site 2 protease, putative [Eimeria tenella]